MEKTILFIHGMFQNAKSWDKWIQYYTQKGYNCVAPSWKYHEGEPSALRANPPEGLGKLRLQELVDQFETEAKKLNNPIIIGHSVGGLIAQILVHKKLASQAVCIATVAPNMMLVNDVMVAFDWNFLKNAATIVNPLKGDSIFEMDEPTFHGAFANTLEKGQGEWERTAVNDSRNVLRDCVSSVGVLPLDQRHVPLLFIGAKDDHIIPAKLVEKNCRAYKEPHSIHEYKEFANRSHYICNEPGWEEVAEYAHSFLQTHDNAIAGGEPLRGTSR